MADDLQVSSRWGSAPWVTVAHREHCRDSQRNIRHRMTNYDYADTRYPQRYLISPAAIHAAPSNSRAVHRKQVLFCQSISRYSRSATGEVIGRSVCINQEVGSGE